MNLLLIYPFISALGNWLLPYCVAYDVKELECPVSMQ